jgi:dipeptidyl-peptidase-4
MRLTEAENLTFGGLFLRRLGLALGFGIFANAASPVLTADDYARAERFAKYNTAALTLHSIEQSTWLPGGKFVYRTTGVEGNEFISVDPAHGTRGPAFDKARLAAALTAATGAKYDAERLPFKSFELSDEGRCISFEIDAKHWSCDTRDDHCSQTTALEPNGALSPDKKRMAFIRDYNLWVRDVTTGEEKQLTTDGVKDFGYATDNPGWAHNDNAIVAWSPDSRKIATFQQDQRGVGEMYLVRTKQGHPELEAWKYPMSGDRVITTIQRVIIEVDERRVVRLRLQPEPYRTTGIKMGDEGKLADAQWSSDGSHLAFISVSRDHKIAQVRIADTATGAVRDVFEERASSFYPPNGGENWRYLPASNEMLWYSARDNWEHIYLYDLNTGKLKNQVTHGDWNVTELLRVDEKKREIYLLGVGREAGRHPYFVHLYKVGFDGSNLTLLTPENAMHDISMSPAGEYFVDSYSTPDTPPATVLRQMDGKLVSVIEKTDISKLVATGWKPPIPITVKARDGVTDLYGLMFKPTNFDESRKYPIVNHIYPGPQIGSVGDWRFAGAGGDAQCLAELGFVVVAINGMGTPFRSWKFQETFYGDMGDNTLPDQISGMKELARRYSWIDLDRAGIYGLSGGGFATADAMFRYPDFFKVGVSMSGNHDQRGFTDQWGELYMGLLHRESDGSSNYDDQANQSKAKNLKGHLLLVHGTFDEDVIPNLTLVVVDALIKANKDFDLLMLPNQHHIYTAEVAAYVSRRRWDYFVRHLLGTEPPHEYELHVPKDTSPLDGFYDFNN